MQSQYPLYTGVEESSPLTCNFLRITSEGYAVSTAHTPAKAPNAQFQTSNNLSCLDILNLVVVQSNTDSLTASKGTTPKHVIPNPLYKPQNPPSLYKRAAERRILGLF